jgi:hypothetical protein
MDGDKWHEHPRLSPQPGAGAVLSLIRSGQAVTRADLARVTGLPRSTLAHRVDALLANHLTHEEEGGAAATGAGRPMCSPSTTTPGLFSPPTSAGPAPASR